MKFRGLLKNWVFWLLIITGIAIILRSIPAWTNAAWGCDFGIYLGLSTKFVESGGHWYNPYSGWGTSYNYFPVLYAIQVLHIGLQALMLSFLCPNSFLSSVGYLFLFFILS